mgnify:CR=1 FL=1
MAGASRPIRSALILLMLIGGLAGCGGGGGDGASSGGAASPIVVSLTPASVTASFPSGRQSLNPPTLSVSATVSNLPTTPIHALIVEDKPVLQPGTHTLTRNPNGTFSASLLLNQDLAVGRHTGTLMLKLCQDAACSLPYAVSGGELPYDVTVSPGIGLTAFVNGIARSTPLLLRDGDLLALQASQPVSWSTGSGGVAAFNVSSSSTSWSATMRYSISTPGNTGTFTVFAVTQSQPTLMTAISISLTQ